MTLIAAILLSLESVAHAGFVHVSASGTFGPLAPNSNTIAPNENFSVSFDVTDPVVDFAPARFSNAQYFLNGSPVMPSINEIDFYADFNGGLFNLFFSDGTTISFFGDQIFDVNGFLIPGTYATAGLFPDGAATVTVTSAVPEPSSLALAGLGGLSWGLIAIRRRAATV